MTPDDRWELPEDSEDFRRIFASAKSTGEQVVFDHDGIYTVSFSPRGPRGSANEFLSKGRPADDNQ
jgi:hypothetical protein